jgi:pimeloyl-ACP methyl ester carboxylesterase
MHAFYLHGFASSPQSSKARFFAARLATHGVELQCPDFNAPDFATLTVSRMIEQTAAALAALPPGPAVLIGSSLGALVAWHVAARAESGPALAGARVHRLVLLAPAWDFGTTGLRSLGADVLMRWRDQGSHEFFHYAYGEPRPVRYALFEDAGRYRSELARVTVPTLVFQGTRDESVDPDGVIAFASGHSNVILRLLDDDHQLLASVETIWADVEKFLELRG